MSLFLGILSFVLVLISLFLVLVILMQRTKSDGGVGAALGGGAAEQAFGGETGNVLTRATTVAAVAFFVLSFVIYLGHIRTHRDALKQQGPTLPTSSELTAGASPVTPVLPSDAAAALAVPEAPGAPTPEIPAAPTAPDVPAVPSPTPVTP